MHLVTNSAPVACFSKKQTIVALSSTGSKLEGLKTEAKLTACPYCMSAISPIVPTGAALSTPVRYSYVKSMVADHSNILVYVPATHQLAGIFTKARHREQSMTVRDMLLACLTG
jgi:hypothetical protein